MPKQTSGRRRWYQFNLASGLTVLLLFCILLAWWRDHQDLSGKAERNAQLREMLLEQPKEQLGAVEVRANLGYESPDEFIASLQNNHDWLLEDSLAVRDLAIGEALAPMLIDLLSADKQETRVRAAGALGHLASPVDVIVPALLRVYDDPDERFHYSVVSALGEIGPEAKDALPVLLAALEDPAEPHQGSVAMAIWKIGRDRRGVDALVQRLAHDDAHQRIIAADYLRLIGPEHTEHAIPALMRARTDSDPTLRSMALSALVQLLPREDALDVLAASVNDDDSHVRQNAGWLLRSLAE